jgi:hypothetical protein
MNNIRGFSARRILLLIRNDLFFSRSFLLLSLGTAAAVLFLASLQIRLGRTPVIFLRAYDAVLFLIGVATTERVFKGIHDEVKGPAWLTVPASTLEKFSARAIFLTVILSAVIMVFYFLISLLFKGGYHWFGISGFPVFNPFQKTAIKGIHGYFILQSIFMLGAIYFRKSPSVKTLLSLVIYSLILYTAVWGTGKILFEVLTTDYHFTLLSDPFKAMQGLFLENNGEIFWSVARWSMKIGYWYLLAPICWVTGYLRLKEKEV